MSYNQRSMVASMSDIGFPLLAIVLAARLFLALFSFYQHCLPTALA